MTEFKYPFNLITQYVIENNHIDMSLSYEISEIPARELIAYNRFDLMAKWMYIDAKEKGLTAGCGYRVYYDNIHAFSCGRFSEPGTAEKDSFAKYIDDLDRLIVEMKGKGFDASKSLIPLGMNDDVIDGSHRVSTAAYYDKKVTVIRFPELKRVNHYDYAFFRKYLMSDVSMGYMAIQYAHLKENCYMACLWPKADRSRMDEVESKLQSIGHIVYAQDVYLTYQGMCNLMTQAYGHQAWTGSIENHFSGVRGKVDACYQEKWPVRTYLFEAPDMDSVVDIKRQIREIFQIQNHSVHISDNWNETIDMVELLYNRNSVDFMNRANPYKYSMVYRKIRELKELIEKNGCDKSRFIIDSSAVLEVCGLRPARDLDFLTDYAVEVESRIEGGDDHRSQLPYYRIALPDILYDPESYFYFEGMKFITPQKLVEMKTNRGEAKDLRDVKMLRKYMKKRLSIPKAYRYETIDRIHQYQIAHRLYGKGAYSYVQYRDSVRRNRILKGISLVKRPLGAVWYRCFDENAKMARKREKYVESQRKRLKNTDVTIISSNCNGGVISSDLGLPFRSPFVNLFIKSSDYIKLLTDLRGYMGEQLCFVKETDPVYGDVSYPTAYLKDVKIYFMHYDSERDAQEAWDRRKKRMNWDHLYVLYTDRSGCSMDDLKAFDALPYEHKVVFTHIPQPEIKSAYYITGYENETKVGILSDWQDESRPVKRVYDQFDYVGWFNGEFEVGQ